MSTPKAAVGFMLRHTRAQAPPRGWQNGRMSASGPDGSDDQREVLSSLPRSRRQRPTARREAARAKRAKAGSKPAATPKSAAAKAAPAAAKPAQTTTKPKARAKAAKPARKPAAKAPAKARTATNAAVRPRPAKRAIPPAGYATPRTEGRHGSADPGAALAGLVRSVLKRIPRP